MAGTTRGMILAAGLGTRLRPLTYFRAKAAIPFLNRPLISYSLELLRRAEIAEVMVNLHHLPDTVRVAAAGHPMQVSFSFEDEILGTAGCLRKVSDFLGENTFIVSNGKTYFEQNLREALEDHQRSDALVTMLLVPFSAGDPYNPVMLDSEGWVVDFARNREPRSDSGTSNHERLCIYTGVQILEPEVLDWIPEGVSDSVNDIYPALMKRGYPIRGFVSDAYWCECSTPGRYLSKSIEVLNLRQWENSSLSNLPEGCRGAIMGEDVHVPPTTQVENSILWSGVSLGAHSSFRSVIITDGVRELPADTHLSDVIVTPLVEGQAACQPSGTIGDQYAFWSLL